MAPRRSSSDQRSSIRTRSSSATTRSTRAQRPSSRVKPRSTASAGGFVPKDGCKRHSQQQFDLGASMNTVQNVVELAGRSLLALLFLLSGFGKIGAYAGTATYMAPLGVPAATLPVVIALEVLGGLA